MPATINHMPIKEARCYNCKYYVKYKQFCLLKQEETRRYKVCLKHEFNYRENNEWIQ